MEYLLIVITQRSTLTEIVVPVRVPFMDQIEMFNHLNVGKRNTYNHLTVCKQISSDLLKKKLSTKNALTNHIRIGFGIK